MLAIKEAVDAAPEDRELRIESDSKWAIRELTTWQEAHKNEGYAETVNGELIAAAVASLRKRKAHTMFKWVKGHNGHAANEKADRIAGEAARRPTADPVDVEVDPELRLTGAALASMTQARAYRMIRRRKSEKVEKRRRTEQNIAQIVEDVDGAFGWRPTDENVWMAIRSKALTLECRYFLWMVAHDAYRLGDKWLYESAPAEVQERAYCKICGAVETMHHILFDCESVERGMIWGEARAMWERTGDEWKDPNLGTVVGAACAYFPTEDGSPRPGRQRLWTILVAEAAHLIWKMRCERVIQREGIQFSTQEAIHRWEAVIGARLDTDRRLTSVERYGRRAMSAQLVESTWRPVVIERESLPYNWVTDIGVLVGIKGG
ncbi:hypothetical protein GGG16DRAFT_61566 [Schizophyllum commune]